MRYQQWWFSEFPKQFRKYYDEVIVLGEKWLSEERSDSFSELFKGMFSPINISIQFETVQIMEYLRLELRKDDILFLADLSFPGFFSNVLYHKRPKKMFAFCHATSLNAYDYFQPVRKSKFVVETGHAKLFDAIFVGSHYHKKKLVWDNVIVSGVPKPPFQTYNDEKTIDILSISRPSIQKVNKKLEKKIERNFGKIHRLPTFTWASYYHLISNAKIVLFTGKEDTFSYSILETVLNNSIPVAPNKYAYPELLSREFLYDNIDEAIYGIWNGIHFPYQVPKIQCIDLVDEFFKNVADVMKEL
jgi:L-fucose mutarotase/ribose pyranase (RbsD/FucU family)